jgi:hypothetical protein
VRGSDEEDHAQVICGGERGGERGLEWHCKNIEHGPKPVQIRTATGKIKEGALA